MYNYETLFVLKPELEEEAIKANVDKFSEIITKGGGEIVSVDEWGKKKLAYPILDRTEGYYVLTTFNAGGELPSELERNFRITEDVMRYLVKRLDRK